MRHDNKTGSLRQAQKGYAILMVLFFVALLFIAAMSVAPNILTQGRRERETEMIWRGKQYERAVKLYYRKTGKFPTSLDDLTKPQVGNIRFMRQAYKDPMNSKDGEWRLIYIGPTGQLIGSLNPARKLQIPTIGGPGGAPVPGTPASQVAAQSGGQSFGQSLAPGSGPGFGQSFGQGLNQAAGQVFGNSNLSNPNSANAPNGPGGLQAPQQNVPSGQTNSAASADSTGAASSASADTTDSAVADAANDALLNAEPTTVIGGRIIGVGSKINRRSIIVYEKARNYKQFEFIWDPSKDPIVLGAAGALGQQVGTPAGTLGGQANPGTAPNGAPGFGNMQGQYPGGFNPSPPTTVPTPPEGTQPPP